MKPQGPIYQRLASDGRSGLLFIGPSLILIGLFALLFGYFYVAILDWFVRQGMLGGMGLPPGLF